MPEPWDNLEVGQTFTLGGSNIDGLAVGPYRWPATLEIYAWHTGAKTGEGNSAHLALNYDGAEVARVEDANFDNYSLPIPRTAYLAAGASTAVSISYGNVMADKRSHGLQVTVKRIKPPAA